MKKKTSKKIYRIVQNAVFFLIWLFLFFKIFIADIDLIIINKLFPNNLWIKDYRWLGWAIFISISWLLLGNKKFGLGTLKFIFFPLILIFWRSRKHFF